MRSYPIGYVRPENRLHIPPPERDQWAEWDEANGETERRLRDLEFQERQRKRSQNRRWVAL